MTKGQYRNIETGKYVLVLMIDDHYVHYQQDGLIKYDFKHDFVEQFTKEESE